MRQLRRSLTGDAFVRLHGFCDASGKAGKADVDLSLGAGSLDSTHETQPSETLSTRSTPTPPAPTSHYGSSFEAPRNHGRHSQNTM